MLHSPKFLDNLFSIIAKERERENFISSLDCNEDKRLRKLLNLFPFPKLYFAQHASSLVIFNRDRERLSFLFL